jgi:hypothetical protein
VVADALEDSQFTGDVDTELLLVSELVTNAVLHAHTDCTIVVDFGKNFMHTHVVDLDERDVMIGVPGETAEGGRGLNIVSAVAREWGVTRNPTGKSVWFVLSGSEGTGGVEGTRRPRAERHTASP